MKLNRHLMIFMGYYNPEVQARRPKMGYHDRLLQIVTVCSSSTSGPTNVQYREQRGRQCVEENPSQVFTLNEQEWQKMEQENVLKNITLAFDTTRTADTAELDYDNDENEVAGDALTLASLLQQQIDAINLELKYVMCALMPMN